MEILQMRDNFSEATKKLLADRAGRKCSNPYCRRTTIGPQLGDKGTVNIGEAAHIYAASPGGKRYKEDMTSEQRSSYENGIWMCRTHAALIDRDEKYFTVEMLKSWKEDAEKNAADEIIGQVDEVRTCKFRMNLFYMDFLEDKKILASLNKSRGAMVDESCFPVQNEWEKHLEEISYLIGAELSTSMYRILRELQVFKEIMKKEIDRCAGRRMSDKESLAYCRRADLFKERMEEWLTDEFIESIKFFCDFSKE